MDVSQIPAVEDERVEFKCSAISDKELRKKINCGVAALANSGGGQFIVGIDDKTGDPDGGISNTVGNTPLRDWIDQVIGNIEPAPHYSIDLLSDAMGRGTIDSGNVVAVITVPHSHVAPHMSYDNKFYIRAGAHTVPARSFIVEALFARRHQSKPRLKHVLAMEPTDDMHSDISIELVCLTSSPAIDVSVSIKPVPPTEYDLQSISATLIDTEHPFGYRFEMPHAPPPVFDLEVTYRDLASNDYRYTAQLDCSQCVDSYNRIPDAMQTVASTLQRMERKLRH